MRLASKPQEDINRRVKDHMRNDHEHELVSRIENLFDPGEARDARGVVDALVEIGKEMGPTDGARFISHHPHLLGFRGAAGAHYENLILQAEQAEAETLLAAEAGDSFDFTDLTGVFGKRIYDRVSDMFDHVDFSGCRRFVLVGCGALPATMFHVHDMTDVPEILGLDTRAQAIEALKRITRRFGLTRIRPVLGNGGEFDFQGSGVVYVANMVSPKRQVLERIVATAPENVQIILRDPYSLGRLLTELGTERLDPRLEVVGEGTPEPAYLSRDVFLRRSEGSLSPDG